MKSQIAVLEAKLAESAVMSAVQSRLLRAAKEDEKRAVEEISETLGKQLRNLEENNFLLQTKIGALEKERHDMIEIIRDQTKTLKLLGSRSEYGKGSLGTLPLDNRGTEPRRDTPQRKVSMSDYSHLYLSPEISSAAREPRSHRSDRNFPGSDVNEATPLQLASKRSPPNRSQSEVTPASPWTSSPAIGILAKKFANDLKPVCKELDELRICVSVQAERERSAQSRIDMLQTQLAREIQFRKACEANLEHLQHHGLEEIEKYQQQMQQERLRAAAVLRELEQSLLSERSQRQSDGRAAAANAERALRLEALAQGLSSDLRGIAASLRDTLAAASSEQSAWEEGERRRRQQRAAAEEERFERQLLGERDRAADVLRDMERSLLEGRAEREEGARRLARGRDAALMLASAARELGAELAAAGAGLRSELERHLAELRAAGDAERRRAAAERRALEQALVRDRTERVRSGLAVGRQRAQAAELTRQVLREVMCCGEGLEELDAGTRAEGARGAAALTELRALRERLRLEREAREAGDARAAAERERAGRAREEEAAECRRRLGESAEALERERAARRSLEAEAGCWRAEAEGRAGRMREAAAQLGPSARELAALGGRLELEARRAEGAAAAAAALDEVSAGTGEGGWGARGGRLLRARSGGCERGFSAAASQRGCQGGLH